MKYLINLVYLILAFPFLLYRKFINDRWRETIHVGSSAIVYFKRNKHLGSIKYFNREKKIVFIETKLRKARGWYQIEKVFKP